jgi:hypothetical protein
MLVYFMAIWKILLTFGIFYGHFADLAVIWYIFPHFGILYQEKSGNPGRKGQWEAAASICLFLFSTTEMQSGV